MRYRYLLIPAMRRALQKQRREYDWTNRNPEWVPGRIDPFNPVKFRMLELPVDDTIGNSEYGAHLEHEGAARDVAALEWA